MSLKPGESVPPIVYEKYQSKKIALTIVYKKYVEDEKQESEQVASAAYDYFGDTEIQLAFKEKNLESIIERGFLNTFQVPKAMEAYRRARAKLDDGFLGYHLDKSFPPENSGEVHPKSAFLSLNAGGPESHPFAAEGSSAKGVGLGYGNIIAVLNNDVKDRTTFTMGDSTAAHSKRMVRTLRFKSPVALKMIPHQDYIEAQVWGPVAVTDVQHFLANCESNKETMFGASLLITNESKERIKRLKIPLFECVEERIGGLLIRLKKGKPL